MRIGLRILKVNKREMYNLNILLRKPKVKVLRHVYN